MAFRQTLKILSRLSIPARKCGLAFAVVKCSSMEKPETQVNLSKLQPECLSFEYFLQQSTMNSVNNVSQILTITYAAIENASKEYRALLIKLINLIRESIMFEQGDEHWDEILKIRSLMEDRKILVIQLVQYMHYVHKMADATSEVCYSSGMDSLSQTLIQRIDDALRKMEIQVNENTKLEAEYTSIQEQSIVKSKANIDATASELGA